MFLLVYNVIVMLLLLIQIVSFLNDLYTCFDNAIEKFDVYKVSFAGLA
jgi:hypothetical protein